MRERGEGGGEERHKKDATLLQCFSGILAAVVIITTRVSVTEASAFKSIIAVRLSASLRESETVLQSSPAYKFSFRVIAVRAYELIYPTQCRVCGNAKLPL